MHGASAEHWGPGDCIADRWEIQNIMQGGMGVVYVVRDLETGERLAAKTYRRDLLDPRVVSRFQREADVWLSLGAHDNVVTARYFRIVENVPLLFLEYVDGVPLNVPVTPRSSRRYDSRCPARYEVEYEQLEPVQTLAMEFCSGMMHARKFGLTAHRDIKPSNCLIDIHGSMKISDFGLAKIFDAKDLCGSTEKFSLEIPESDVLHADTPRQDSETLAYLSLFITQTGIGAGTAPYMAPEQFDDFKRADVRSDIYSFGVMLYQMVTGSLPFRGKTWVEYRSLHQTVDPPALTTWFAIFNETVARCLAKSPSDRFSCFDELYDSLEKAVFAPYEDEYDLHLRPNGRRELTEDERLVRAVSQAELGNYDKALAELGHMLEQNSSFAEAWRESGCILLHQLQRIEEALHAFHEAQRLGLDVHKEIRLCHERLSGGGQ